MEFHFHFFVYGRVPPKLLSVFGLLKYQGINFGVFWGELKHFFFS